MCDPISIIGLGFSIGSAVANQQAQQDMVNQQNDANAQWVAYQRRQSQEYAKRDEELRKNAAAARESSLSDLDAKKQQEAQTNEQARLTTALTPEQVAAMARGDTSAIDKTLLQGQAGTEAGVKSNIQMQIQQAAQDARKRIAALAAVQSYGGSQFGLTNRANAIFNAAGQDIRLASDERQGQLAAYNVAKAVEPIKIVQHGSSSAGGIANAMAGVAGKGLGSAMAGMV
jgi:FlaG/FlaF family flagellin (archaellin)